MSRSFLMDCATGQACIAKVADMAVVRTPLARLNDVLFHTDFNYLKIRHRFGSSFYIYQTNGNGQLVVDVQSVYLGSTSLTNPLVFMQVDGYIMFGAYLIQSGSNYVRNIYLTTSGGAIYLRAVTQICGSGYVPATSRSGSLFVATADPEW